MELDGNMDFVLCLEVIGTIIFALQGSMVAIEYNLDVLGIFVLALTTAVGGGMTRDIILGNTPPNMFKDPIYCIVAAVVALLVICTYKVFVEKVSEKALPYMRICGNVSDAIGLGIFTVVGMQVSMKQGYMDNAFLCIFVGVITGVGGGMLRDIFVRRTPVILTKEIYAVAAIIGGILYWHLRKFIEDRYAVYLATSFIVIIRLLAVKKDLHLPRIKEREHAVLQLDQNKEMQRRAG